MRVALLALVKKDLMLFRQDRRAMIVTLAAPLVLASFFGFLFGGKSGEVKPRKLHLLVVDADSSEVSRAVVAAMSADQLLDVATAPSAAAAREIVRGGDAAVAIVFPAGFGTGVKNALGGGGGGQRPQVTILYDPSHRAEVAIAQGVIIPHVMHALFPDAGAPPRLPYDAEPEAVTAGENSAYNGYAHSFAGMGVQFVLFSTIELAMAILTERQRGLWRRLRAAPLSRATILGSKAVSGALIAMFTMVVLFSFSITVFHVHIEGSLPGLLAICAAYSLMAATLGLLIAAFGKTPQATRGVSVFVMLIATMLGGAWVPAFLFPGWLQKLTYAVPTRWAVDGLDKMTWRGLGLATGLTHAAVLLGFAAVFGTFAWLRFRWEEA